MSEWREVRIGDVCKVGDGAHAKVARQDKGVLYLTSKNFDAGKLKLDDVDFISEEDYERLFPEKSKAVTRLQSNDILMGIIGTFGNAYRYQETDHFGVSSSVAIIRPDSSELNADFLVYLLNSEKFKCVHRSYSSGSVQGYSNIPTIKQMPFSLPSVQTQEKIVAILKSLDRKIENLRKQNETLEALVQILFKHWFVDFEFPSDDDKPYKSSGGEMETSELGGIPAGWRIGKLGDEVETLGGGTPSTKEPDYWINGDIPWYSPTDLTKSNTLFSLGSEKQITKLGLEKSSAKLFSAYSVLLTSRATIGEIAINTKPACTNQGFITLIPNEKFSVYFLYSWLLTQINIIKQLASGSTFPELSKSNFRSFLFLIPESKQLNNFDKIIEPMFHKIENNIKQINTLNQFRDVLLPKLINGQIKVRD